MAEKAPIKLDWDPWKLMNVTKDELRAVQERKKMSEELKARWQRIETNPHAGGRGGHHLDPAVQRWLSARAKAGEHFKISTKTLSPFMFFVVLPIGALTYLITKEKEELNRQIKSGELTARDRQFKWSY